MTTLFILKSARLFIAEGRLKNTTSNSLGRQLTKEPFSETFQSPENTTCNRDRRNLGRLPALSQKIGVYE